MKLILLLLFCWSASAQSPLSTGSGIDWTRSGSTATWYPTNSANAVIYWYDTTNSTGIKTNTDCSGNESPNAFRVGGWVNAKTAACANETSAFPTNFVSGGGSAGNSPRISFSANNSIIAVPSGITWTNFTLLIMVKPNVASTANARLFNNGTTEPYVQINANKWEVHCGSLVSGASTITTAWYELTWIQTNGVAYVLTNNVLYVTGSSGTHGQQSASAPSICGVPIANHFNCDIGRIWMWTNGLSSADLASAHAQCLHDFP